MLKPSRPLNTDRMDLLPREDIMTAANLALDAIQNLDPEDQVMGVATLFAAIAQRTMLQPEGLFQRGRKVLAPEPFHDKANTHGEVLRDFVGLRVMGQEVTTC